MLQNVCTPLFDDGDDITVRVTAPVVGKTFADISADIQSGPAITSYQLDAAYDGGNFQAATCAAGSKPIGVFAYDQPTVGQTVPVKAGPGYIVPVTAGAAIVAGQEVQSDAAGKAIPVGPTAASAAHAQTGTVGANNALTYTAEELGFAGNGITITLRDPGAATQALSVTVNGNDIVVNLATDGSSVVTSTATQVAAAIAASAAASSLVTVANTGASTGAGVVAPVAATHLAGGSDPGQGRSAGKAFTSASSGADCFVRLYT